MYFAYIAHLVGILYLFYLSLRILKFIVDVVKVQLGGDIDFIRFGAWAVVTGCTDGIGKAYANQLASKGLNIVLMSRNQNKLEAVASEIEKEHGVETKIIQIDFSGGHEIYDDIPKKLEGLEIGVLVNNVGVFPGIGYFGDIIVEDLWKIVNVNALAMTMMTRLVLPAMCERKKGVVINVSSIGSIMSGALMNGYCPTKIYMSKLSSDLHYEYADKGIIIQCVLPAVVATNMSEVKKTSLFVPSPDDFVRAVLRKVGAARSCYGYWPHELQAFIFASIPEWISAKLVLNNLKDLRAKGFSKPKEKST